MKLDVFQAEQAEWQTRNFPETVSWQVLLGVGEEAGELMHAHLKGSQDIRHSPEEVTALKRDAVGDIVVYLAAYCTLEGINLDAAVAETWDEVKKRDWIEDSETGVEIHGVNEEGGSAPCSEHNVRLCPACGL